jgi:hypothetical protein
MVYKAAAFSSSSCVGSAVGSAQQLNAPRKNAHSTLLTMLAILALYTKSKSVASIKISQNQRLFSFSDYALVILCSALILMNHGAFFASASSILLYESSACQSNTREKTNPRTRQTKGSTSSKS